MRKTKSHETYVKELEELNNGIKVIDKYVKSNTKITHECKYGHQWKATPANILNAHGCPVCSGHKACLDNCLAVINPKLSSEWHPTKNGSLTPYCVLQQSNKKVWWLCNECNHEWTATIDHRTNGTGCTNCFKKGMSIRLSKSHERYLYELNVSDISIKPLEQYRGAHTKILHQCENNHKWLVTPGHILHDRGCPICKESKGEKRIRKWLIDNSIKFDSQKEYDGLVGKGGGFLSYDFYIPKLNTLIEFQGIQHEKYVKGLHKNAYAFKRQIEHDKRKKEYAIQNNIKLLEIWYWDFENIENVLTEITKLN